jgi:hypothetical protein
MGVKTEGARADRPLVSTVRWWSRKDMARWKKAIGSREFDRVARRKSIYAMEKDGHLLVRKPVRWSDTPVAVIWRRIRAGLSQTQRPSRLHRSPGYGLLCIADFFYSRKSVEECLRPTIQDLQDEYIEALAANRPHKARWVRIRGTWSFVCAAGLLTMASVGKQVVKIWKAVG